MNFTGIEHFAIAARSPEGLADWYARAMGFRTHTTFDNGEGQPKSYMICLGTNQPMIEIIPADRTKSAREKLNTEPGLVHVAIAVKDFNAALATLSDHGARPEGEERVAANGTRAQFFRDPEGNLFHILFRTEPLARNP
jgi:catechol 2,3-dioxygenase-like lactoylglutathione lyase family enzyme